MGDPRRAWLPPVRLVYGPVTGCKVADFAGYGALSPIDKPMSCLEQPGGAPVIQKMGVQAACRVSERKACSDDAQRACVAARRQHRPNQDGTHVE